MSNVFKAVSLEKQASPMMRLSPNILTVLKEAHLWKTPMPNSTLLLILTVAIDDLKNAPSQTLTFEPIVASVMPELANA